MAKPVQGVTSSPKLNAPNALIQLNTLSPAIGRCGWWIEIGVDPLVEALREAMTLTDEERRAMCENGRRLVEAKYQWPMIAKAMEKVYEGCV
jgi:glycosyltransferase involved in cell wall biosynthesis